MCAFVAPNSSYVRKLLCHEFKEKYSCCSNISPCRVFHPSELTYYVALPLQYVVNGEDIPSAFTDLEVFEFNLS